MWTAFVFLSLSAEASASTLRIGNDSRSFLSIPYVSGPENKSFLNASLVLLELNASQSCKALLTSLPSDFPSSKPFRGLLLQTEYVFLCFIDDIAREVEGSYDFILHFSSNTFSPIGWTARDTYRNKGAELPHFEVDLDPEWIGAYSDVRVDVFPSENPYTGASAFTAVIVLLSFTLGVLSVCKFVYSVSTLRIHYGVSKGTLTPGIKILFLESIAALLGSVVAVDCVGIFGIFSSRFWYTALNGIGVLGFITTYMLGKAFNAVLNDSIGEPVFETTHFMSSLLFLSVMLPIYEALSYITRLVISNPFISALNSAVAVLFECIFAVLFFKVKNAVLRILLKSKENSNNLAQKIDRMQKFMFYSSICMFAHILTTGVLGIVVGLSDGKATCIALILYLIASTVVGMCQVLALPRVPDQV